MEVSQHWRLKQVRYNLTGSVCPACGHKSFPPRQVCPHCGHHAGDVVYAAVEATVSVPAAERVA